MGEGLIEILANEWVVVVDTREQRPWVFENISRWTKQGPRKILQPVVHKALPSGDYSIEGHEDYIAIERKSGRDLLATLTRGRRRFERELTRLQSLPWSAVVVECEWSGLMALCRETSRITPLSVEGSLVALAQRYPKTHWIMRPGRDAAEMTAWRALDRYWRDHGR